MAILQSYYQDVYRSPVVRLSGYSGRHELASSILAYLDFGGATGTCKDGVAETMLAFATERGTLQPGMPVVEASSGSFGAALAVSCATTGHPCILVVPSSLPLSRRQHLQNLGARIVVCGSGGRRALEQVAKDTAARMKVDMRMYRVIYDAINEVEAAMKGMLSPKFKEVDLGRAEVRNVFRITGVGMVAGCYVLDGKMQRNAQMRLLRDNIVIYDGAIASLQRFKDSVKEVAAGYECGITFEKFQDIKEGDIIEAFIMEQIQV